MGFNLFLKIDLNLLTLGFLSLNFSVAYTKHRCPKKKKSSSGAKVIGWLICCQNMRALRIHNAPILQILCAPHSEQIEIFSPLYRSYARARAPVKRYFLFVSIREVLYSASSGSSLWARTLRGQNQRQRPITNGLLPTSSKCSDSMSTNCT